MPGSRKKIQINNTPQVKQIKNHSLKTPRSRRKKNPKKMKNIKKMSTPETLFDDSDSDSEEEYKTPMVPNSPVKRKLPRSMNTPADAPKTPQSYNLANALNDSVLVMPDKSKNPDPFIPNEKTQYRNQSFGSNEGIDFYIDYARFLPDNVTATKCIIRAFNYDMVRLIQRAEGTPDVTESTTFNPYFGFRYEFRLPHFDPTTIVAITLETIDRTTMEVAYIGHCFFPLFLDKKSKQPTADPAAQGFMLQEGNYQIPIY